MSSQPHRQSNALLAAFSGPCLPLAGLGLPLVVYLPPFFASDLGLGLAAVGAAFGGVKLLDMFFDPVIGVVMDRTRSKLGRFKLWMILGVPIVMLGSYMLFMAKPGVGIGYLWLGLLVIYAGFSITTIAQTAWASMLSPEYNQRSRIYAWWQGGNVVGIVAVLVLPALLPLLGYTDHALGVAAMGWFVILLMPLTVALAAWRVPEPMLSLGAPEAKVTDYVALLRRPTVQRILLIDVMVGTGPAIMSALALFFFQRVKNFEAGETNILLLVYFIGGLVGAPIWAKLAYVLGKHRSLALAGLVYAIVAVGVLLVPEGNLLAGSLMMLLIGVPYAAGLLLLRAMMADAGDELRLETGGDRAGLLFALLISTVKVVSAIAVPVTYGLLQGFGFEPRETTGDTGETALAVIFSVVPAAFALVGSAMLLRYPLTGERHAEIRRLLDERDAASPQPSPTLSPLPEDLHVRTP